MFFDDDLHSSAPQTSPAEKTPTKNKKVHQRSQSQCQFVFAGSSDESNGKNFSNLVLIHGVSL